MRRSGAPRLGLVAVIVLLIAAPARGAHTARASPTAFRNPIAPLLPGGTPGSSGPDSPDPWIFTFRDRYYLTNTAGSRIVLRSAGEIGGLASAPLRQLWPRPRRSPPAALCCEFWGPEIHRLRGPHGWRWYVYSAADDGNLLHHRLQVLESARDDPAGPYRLKGMLQLGPDYQIDPTVFALRGREYVIYSDAPAGSFFPTHLALAALRDPWTVAGPPVTISTPTFSWENTGFAINEAPEVLRHGPWLHVIYSAGWCALSTYNLGRLTIPATANVLDPRAWSHAKAPEPVFQSDPARGVWGTGHGSFFRSPDGRQDWQVYHATDSASFGCFSGFRTTRAQRFTWNPDGTPAFGRPVSLSTDLAAPAGDATLERQFEDAPVVARAGAGSRDLADANFVGEAGATVAATRAGGFVTYLLAVPKAGRYRILVRLGTGPTRHRVTVVLATRRRRWRLRTADTHRATAGVEQIDFGTVPLPAGPVRFRFILRSPGSAILDQVMLAR